MKKKLRAETIRRQNVIEGFGKHLKQLRENYNMSQLQLSLSSGITITYISKIENGRFNTSISHLAALAEAFELPLRDLMDFQEV